MQSETFRQKDWKKDRILNLVLDGTETLGNQAGQKTERTIAHFYLHRPFFLKLQERMDKR